jgi:hypothetical protein
VQSAKGCPDIEFWKLVVHYKRNGSGPRYLSGWVTVFCLVDDKGAWMCDLTKTQTRGTFQFIREREDNTGDDTYSRRPIIDINRIPSGSYCVDVIADDCGTVYNCELVAGHGSYIYRSRHTNLAQCRVVLVVEEVNKKINVNYINQGTQIRPNVEWSLSLKK